MVVLRATARLQKRLKAPVEADPGKSTTSLGDWYANLIHLGRKPFVIAVSGKSLLAVLVPAQEVAALPERFPGIVRDRLLRLGATDSEAALEAERMHPVVAAPTDSRSIVGALNIFARDIRDLAPYRPEWEPAEWEAFLEKMISSPLGMRHPREAAMECLGSRER